MAMFKENRFEVQEREGFMTEVSVIVDKETGVNYLFVHRGYGAGLTPLLDSEGKPVVTKGSW